MDNGRGIARRVLTIVAIAIGIALVWVSVTTLWLWRYQERVVFQPPAVWAEAPAPARRVAFRAADGHELFGYVLTPPGGTDTTAVVIAFHGNADLAAWTVPWAREVVELTGLPVLIPEYRGYAGIPGSPTYASASADARGALCHDRRHQHCQPRGCDRRAVMGGGTALRGRGAGGVRAGVSVGERLTNEVEASPLPPPCSRG